MDIYQRWKQTTIANKGLVFSGTLMAFGTLFYAGAAIVQVCIMKQSAHDVSLQTDKLIKASEAEAFAARKNAEAAAAFATSAEGINQQTAAAVAKLQNLATATKQAADTASDTLTKGSRPWIGITGIPVVESITPGQAKNTFTVNLTPVIRNYGSSPALLVTVTVVSDIIREGESSIKEHLQEISILEQHACQLASASLKREPAMTFTVRNGVTTQGQTTVPPMGLTVFPNEPAPYPLATDYTYRDATDLASNNLRLVGCAAYTDQFSTEKHPVIHHTLFCYHTPGALKDFTPQERLVPCLLSQNAD